jgi:hypothetical protein
MMIGQEQTPAISDPAGPANVSRRTGRGRSRRFKAQLANLRVDLAGLQAQWQGSSHSSTNMLRNNPARPGVQQQWADVGVQMARVQGDIAHDAGAHRAQARTSRRSAGRSGREFALE